MVLPRIHVVGTGGTIAGAGASATDAAYVAGSVTAADLVAAVPGLEDIADVRAETLFSVGSEDLGPVQWSVLARRVQALTDDPQVDGVVITHGTDTLEEAVFFLDLTCRTKKPIVMTAAMRAATALGADGPANLYQAVRTACSPAAGGRGVLVAMNGLVLPGWQTIKTNSVALETFMAYPGGPVGRLTGERLWFLEPARTSPLAGRFADVLRETDDLPSVGIAFLYGGCANRPLDAWRGCGGLVIAGFGGGTTTAEAAQGARAMADDGCIVVVSSRVSQVSVLPETMTPDQGNGILASGYLNPQKSAVLLTLALAAGWSADRIADAFETIFD
jgi:L-asparaginase